MNSPMQSIRQLVSRRTLLAPISRTFVTSAVVNKPKKQRPASLEGVPDAPTQPLGPYNVFLLEAYPAIRERIRDANGKVSLSAASKEVATQWSNLSEQDKKKYGDAYKKARAEWLRKYVEWYQARTFKELVEMEAFTGKHLLHPGSMVTYEQGKRVVQRLPGHEGAPARPSGSFFLFCQELRNSGRADQILAEAGVDNASVEAQHILVKTAGEEWGVMSPEKKQEYKDKATAEENKWVSYLESQGVDPAQYRRRRSGHEKATRAPRKKKVIIEVVEDAKAE